MNKPLKFKSTAQRIWWCSDLHLNHTPNWGDMPPLWKSRGFSSIGEHDAWVKDCWFKMVGPDDVIFELGDTTFSDPKGELYRQVSLWPGRVWHVNGNHFSGQAQIYNEAMKRQMYDLFNGMALDGVHVYPTKVNNVTFAGDTLHVYIDGVSVYMQHYPCFVWPELSKDGLHIHGHCHRRLPESNPERTDTGKILDCGVDNAIAYAQSVGREPTPFFSWEDIKTIMARKKIVKRDHH